MEIRLWHELLLPYELAVKEMVIKFKHLKKEHREKELYSPIEQVSGRVKSINSILEKMQRKNISWEELEEKVEDIAGIRIICQFSEDIEKVADIIQERQDMRVLEIKDYITHMKESRLSKLSYDYCLSCRDFRRTKRNKSGNSNSYACNEFLGND